MDTHFDYQKNILIALAIFILCIGESFAQYALSPRVGEVIDQSEREYFGLFPSVEGFVSAKASLRSDRQIEFIITRSLVGFSTDTFLLSDLRSYWTMATGDVGLSFIPFIGMAGYLYYDYTLRFSKQDLHELGAYLKLPLAIDRD